MKFDNNIITKMKNTSRFKHINHNDLLIKEFNLAVAHSFEKIKDTNDLLELINSVNKVIYKKSKSIKIQYLLYHAYHNQNRYIHFYISKKSGGQRTISAPTKALKNIQTTLNYILSCVYKPQMPVHGFLKERSVVTNATHHTEKNYVYNIDLKNFFPSIHKARIEKRLHLPPFNLSDEKSEVATIISRLTTQKVIEYTDSLTGKKELLLLDNKKLIELPGNKKILENIKNSNDDSYTAFGVLPQGAPTSPMISNLICDRLDRRLMGLAKRFKVKYTRYADDITFSSMHNVYQDDSEFILEMKTIIEDQSFEINPKKTRLQKRGYRQEVTGVIVNDKTNVNRHYIKQLRAMLYSIENFGIEKAQASFIKQYKEDKGHIKEGVPSMLNVLSGKLEYLKMVKGAEDSTYKKLDERFGLIIKPEPKGFNCNHNPQRLVQILNKFRDANSPFKASVHSEIYLDSEDDGGYNGDYNKFHKALEVEYNSIKEELKSLSRRINGKISAFLFAEDLGTEERKKNTGYYGWGDNQVKFGWSSPELKKWCCESTLNNPFSFDQIPDKCKDTRKNVSVHSFQDITKIFKDEIEVRDDNDALISLIEDIEVWLLKTDENFVLEFNDEDIIGKTFFTDFHWLSRGIKKIFKVISDNAKQNNHKNIKIEMKKIDNNFELRIINIDSQSKKDPETLLDESSMKGDFNDIKNSFCSLCDWSIEATNKNKSFRVNLLKSDDIEDIEYLNKKIEGFTHIIRFYK